MPLKSRASKLRELLEEKKLEEIKKQKEEQKLKNLEKLRIEAETKIERFKQLENSSNFISLIISRIDQHNDEIKKKKEWQNYVRCEKLPKTNNPSCIREFLTQVVSNLQSHDGNSQNWLLGCNERSLLTQILDIPDTRRCTIKESRESTMKFYYQQLRNLFVINDRLVDYLKNTNLKQNQLNELTTVRDDELRILIKNIINVSTFNITKHVLREMNSLNPYVSVYEFNSNDLVLFISCFKENPLPENTSKLRIVISRNLKCKTTISTKISLETLMTRLVWTKRDLHSDNCRSLYIPKHITSEILSLKESIEEELNVRESMIQVHLNEMRIKRTKYDEMIHKQKELEEMEKKASKGSVKKPKAMNEKKKKSKKVVEEPPIVDESTYIDVEDEYVAYEDEKFYLKNLPNSPDLLNIGINEINLRQFNIIDGILQIECFERPSQPVQIHEHFFLRSVNETYLKNIEFHQTLREPKIERIAKQKKSIFGRSVSVKLEDEIKRSFDELIKVEIEMKDNIFWWEQPKVCRWEENHIKTCEPQEKSKKIKKKLKLFDFDLENSCENIDRFLLAKNYLIPMMPVEFKFFNEQHELFIEKQKEWHQILIDKEKFTEIEARKSQESFKNYILKNCKIHWSFEEFNEIFLQRQFQPRDLFPQKQRKLIEILKNHKEREESYVRHVKIEEDQPAHMMLSELLEQIEKVHESLQPFFDKIEEKRESLKKISEEILETSDSDKQIDKGRWSSQDIYNENFNKTDRKLSFYTGKFGHFGFACRKYCNFPFKKWHLIHNSTEYTNTFTLTTQNFKIEIEISFDGYKFKLPEIIKHPSKVFEKKLFKTVEKLKDFLCSLNLNIFPEDDAVWYIPEVNEKHLSLEFHTYWSMSLLSKYEFQSSNLNHESHRRIINLESRKIDGKLENFKVIESTPLQSKFIDMENSEEVLKFHADLIHLLNENLDDTSRTEGNSILIHQTYQLLKNIRPLSFCV